MGAVMSDLGLPKAYAKLKRWGWRLMMFALALLVALAIYAAVLL